MPPNVSAILLAAGKSRRMGRSKPLLPLGDRPLVRHCLDSLLAGGVEEILMVVGTCGDAVADTALDLPVTVVRNTAPEADMADSVRLARRRLPANRKGVLVALVDHPLVRAGSVASLIEHHRRHPDKILVPTCEGKGGHPTLFPTSVLAEIAELPTLRDIVNRDSARVLRVPVEDPGILLDLDTPEEYRQAALRFREQSTLSVENRSYL